MWPDKTVPVAEAEIDFKYDWAIAARATAQLCMVRA